MIMGVIMLFVKDFFDEYKPGKLVIFDNPHRIVRWGAYVIIFVMIMLTGVFGADQFIYANF